ATVELAVIDADTDILAAKKRCRVANDHRAVRSDRIDRAIDHLDYRAAVGLRLDSIAGGDPRRFSYENCFTRRRPRYAHLTFKGNNASGVLWCIAQFDRCEPVVIRRISDA